MAGLFDGANSVVTATLPQGLQSSDWTMGAWINPNSAGEGNLGVIVRVGQGTNKQDIAFSTVTRTVRARQARNTTIASSNAAGTPWPTGQWTLLLATFRFSDDFVRIFYGTEKLPMAEVSYTTQTAGVGTYAAQATDAAVGNRSDLSNSTFDGSIAHAIVAAREWSLAEMDHFRRTGRPASMASLLAWLPIIGAATTEPDYSGQRSDGTPSLVTQSAGPVLNVPRVPSQRRRPVRP